MKLFKKRPSPAMIVAMAALCVSLVGTAFAGPIAEISNLNKKDKRTVRKISRNISGKVSNRRITQRAPGLSVAAAQNANVAALANTVLDDAITSGKIKDAEVNTQDLANAAATLAKLAENSVDSSKVVDNSLTAADLGPASVGTSELGNNSVNSAKVLNRSLDAIDITSASGAANIDFPSIPANDCVTELIDTNINLQNDVILVSVDDTVVYANGGLSVHAAASNVADLIRVNVCNVTGVAINPASATFRYAVFRR